MEYEMPLTARATRVSDGLYELGLLDRRLMELAILDDLPVNDCDDVKSLLRLDRLEDRVFIKGRIRFIVESTSLRDRVLNVVLRLV